MPGIPKGEHRNRPPSPEMEKIQEADKKEQQNNKQQEIINKAKKNITKIAEDFEEFVKMATSSLKLAEH